MKKYVFSEKVGKKTTKWEIVAETLEEAQTQLTAKLEQERDTPLVGVGLPDYIEPIDPPTDLTLKTYHITFRPDPDNKDVEETITYKALSLDSAEGQFLEDYPEQAGKARETHLPLSNYAVDEENEKNAENPTAEDNNTNNTSSGSNNNTPKQDYTAYLTNLFTNITQYVKLFTFLLFGVIGLDLLITALLGKDQSFGVLNNIIAITNSSEGLSGVIVLFLVYFLFIRSEKPKNTTKK